MYAAATTRTVLRNGIASAFDDGMLLCSGAVAWAALAAIAAYTATCSFAADLAAVVSSNAFAPASTISASTVMVARATLTSFADDSATTPAGSLSAADVLAVAAAVALAAPSSPRLAVVGPAATVILAGGCNLAVARIAALERLLAIGALLVVAPVCAADIVDAVVAELRALSTGKRRVQPDRPGWV